MDVHEVWEKALKNTEILRARVYSLMTFSHTQVPYIFLSESSINHGDTVVRRGEVCVERPTLILPPNIPQFSGFELSENSIDEKDFVNFLLIRGISLPSVLYNNKTEQMDIFEGRLEAAIRHHTDLLQEQEDVHTGLITAPEECWQFSILIFVCSQIAKNAETDIKRLLEKHRRNKG